MAFILEAKTVWVESDAVNKNMFVILAEHFG